jgi:hypothetical protein
MLIVKVGVIKAARSGIIARAGCLFCCFLFSGCFSGKGLLARCFAALRGRDFVSGVFFFGSFFWD